MFIYSYQNTTYRDSYYVKSPWNSFTEMFAATLQAARGAAANQRAPAAHTAMCNFNRNANENHFGFW